MTATQFWWIVPTVSLITAVLGAGAAYYGLVWRYRSDLRGRIVDDVCADVVAAADLATEYWLLDLSSVEGQSGSKQSAAVLAARIWGMAEKVDLGIEIARPHLSKIDMLGMDKPLAQLSDQLTGGRFQEPDRPLDEGRAVEAQIAAAAIVRNLKTAANRKALGG